MTVLSDAFEVSRLTKVVAEKDELIADLRRRNKAYAKAWGDANKSARALSQILLDIYLKEWDDFIKEGGEFDGNQKSS